MSNFIRRTRNPRTDQFEDAEWLDNYYGPRKYAVRFPDGGVYEADAFGWEFGDSAEGHNAMDTAQAWVCRKFWCHNFMYGSEFEALLGCSKHGGLVPDTRLRRFVRRWI